MFIGIKELELHNIPFHVDVPAGEIEYDNQIRQASVLHAEGVAQLLSRAVGEIRIHGRLAVRMNAPCDRCLENASVEVEKRFDLIYLPAEETPEGGEDEIDENAVEVGYYDGGGLQVNEVLREVVLLALPMRLVCAEECKGICPGCGQNRNQVDCHCQPKPLDDRWSKLRHFHPAAGSSHS